MATKTAGKKTTGSKRSSAKSSTGARRDTEGRSPNAQGANPFAAMADPEQMGRLREMMTPNAEQMERLREMMTPEQAFELYRQNARLALDIIDAAIESTAKMRKLQFEGEEEARNLQKRAARHAAEAENPQALVAGHQTVGQEAVQKAMTYWSQMFELVVEMQKRLFAIIDEQVSDVPGVKQAKAAMGMLPDLGQAQKLVSAMQGVLTSGSSTFESMQKVMGDWTKMARQSDGRKS